MNFDQNMEGQNHDPSCGFIFWSHVEEHVPNPVYDVFLPDHLQFGELIIADSYHDT